MALALRPSHVSLARPQSRPRIPLAPRPQRRLIPPPNASIATSLTQAIVARPDLLGIAAIVSAVAFAAAVLLAIPAVLSAIELMKEVRALTEQMRRELPDTLTAMRLASLELSDVLVEFNALGSDLTGGIRSTAQAVVAAEAGVRSSATAVVQVSGAVKDQLVPKLKQAAEAQLQERARLQHSIDMLQATKKTLQRTRAAIQGVGTASQAAAVAAAVRNLGGEGAPRQRMASPDESDATAGS